MRLPIAQKDFLVSHVLEQDKEWFIESSSQKDGNIQPQGKLKDEGGFYHQGKPHSPLLYSKWHQWMWSLSGKTRIMKKINNSVTPLCPHLKKCHLGLTTAIFAVFCSWLPCCLHWAHPWWVQGHSNHHALLGIFQTIYNIICKYIPGNLFLWLLNNLPYRLLSILKKILC